MNAQPKPKRSTLSKILIGVVAVLVACCGLSAIGAVIAPKTTPTATPTANMQTALIEPAATMPPTDTPPATPEPTQAPTVVPTDVPAPTAVPALVGAIPGLQAADVKVSMEQRGFECAPAEKSKTGNYYIWRCTGSGPAVGMDTRVEMWGRSLQTVDFVDAAVINPNGNDEGVKIVLGYIATMPYKDAMPAAAREWVETTLSGITGNGDVKETIIGGVPFKLYGPPTARNLEIGSIDGTSDAAPVAPALSATEPPVAVVTEAPTTAPAVAAGQPVSTNPTGKDTQGNNIVDPPWLPCAEGQIKGSKNGKYHVPGGRYYARTYSDVMCFNSEQEAQAAQFVRALNQ